MGGRLSIPKDHQKTILELFSLPTDKRARIFSAIDKLTSSSNLREYATILSTEMNVDLDQGRSPRKAAARMDWRSCSSRAGTPSSASRACRLWAWSCSILATMRFCSARGGRLTSISPSCLALSLGRLMPFECMFAYSTVSSLDRNRIKKPLSIAGDGAKTSMSAEQTPSTSG